MGERDEREEVAEEATPETNVEEVEQRTDDYEGIVRRIDDLAGMLESFDSKLDGIASQLDALGITAAETSEYVEGVDAEEIAEDAKDVLDELLGIDALDLL